MRDRRFRRSFFGLSVAAAALCAPAAAAQQRAPRHFELAEQSLGSALRAVSLTSGQTIVASADLVANKRSRALTGDYSAEDAVSRLLDGSGLRAVRVGDALVIQRQYAESAQDAQGSVEGAGGGEILVTGTRIRGRAPAGSSVTTIDRKAIEQSGYSTTEQIVRALPQNFSGGPNETTYETQRDNASFNQAYGSSINLRGLGSASTLVLLGGERPPMAGFAGVFTDLSMIPMTAIERIEVLPDGASALYGSDAVAGVVNIIPRSNFRGIETSARLGISNGFREYQGGAVAGVRTDRLRAMAAYEYYYRSRLAAADRSFVSEDLRRYGLGDFRSGPGLPGTITAGGQTFAIPAGQDGRSLTPADLTANTRNVGDRWLGADALPEQSRHAAFASVAYDATDHLELYAQGLFGLRHFDVRMRTGLNASSFSVTSANPFYVDPIGTGAPIRVRRNFINDIGQESSRGESRAIGASAGARYSAGRWEIDAHATYGSQRERSETYNLVNYARLAVALADPNPATAFNPFGIGGNNNPATLDKIRGSFRFGGVYAMWSGQLRADGPLFALPAGDVRLAIGAEHRNERYRETPSSDDTLTLAPAIGSIPLLAGRRIDAAYAELSLPLSGTAGGLGIGRLDLSAAVRGERYSDFGSTVNPKFGVSWEPASGLVLRGTYGTSFRAPNFNDLRQDGSSTLYFTYSLPDPASPTGVTNALIVRGNNPAIGAEKAASWTAGIDFRSTAAKGVFARMTYFDIDYRDRIANPSAALFTFFTNRQVYSAIINDHPDPAVVATYYASPYYADYLGIPASAVTSIVDARNQNLASQHETGIDFDLGYRFSALGGSGEVGASGSYLFELSQRLTRGAPAIDIVDTLSNPTDLRVRGRATYGNGGFGAAAFVNYTDSYSNDSTGVRQHVGSWTTLDFQLSYRFGERRGPIGGVAISLSAINLFDTDPPRTIDALSVMTAGYDVENATPLGRVFALQVTKSW